MGSSIEHELKAKTNLHPHLAILSCTPSLLVRMPAPSFIARTDQLLDCITEELRQLLMALAVTPKGAFLPTHFLAKLWDLPS